MEKTKVYLTLQNGKVFEGYRFGADGDVAGELVFSTGMVGYLKTLTDPAYFGQIVVQTFPMIGNYGVIESEFDSEKPYLNAYVVREYCEIPSNFRCGKTLDQYMKESGVIGVYGVDTRELTRILREEGVMNACISSKVEDSAVLSSYAVKDAVACVNTVKKTYGEGGKYTVALWDFGVKNSSIEDLTANGFKVIRMPAKSTAEEILSLKADGVILSEGPGDPNENTQIIEEVKKLLGKTPVFGFGLGHQLIALATGAKVSKMKYGHRGGNQPVKSLNNERVYISSQNHGYVVEEKTLTTGTVDYINVNDGTCEGIDYPALKAFTVQFSPASMGVACESNALYNKFIAIIEKE